MIFVDDTTLHAFDSDLTLPAPFISESCVKTKINLNFYFHTSLWYLKRLGLHKTF